MNLFCSLLYWHWNIKNAVESTVNLLSINKQNRFLRLNNGHFVVRIVEFCAPFCVQGRCPTIPVLILEQMQFEITAGRN
jgi:hypothetical protein